MSTPGSIVLVGFFAGLIIETVRFVARDERYKSILRFSWDHPGFFIMGATSTVAVGMMFRSFMPSISFNLSSSS